MNIKTGDVMTCGGHGYDYDEKGDVSLVLEVTDTMIVQLVYTADDNRIEIDVFNNPPRHCFRRNQWEGHNWKFV